MFSVVILYIAVDFLYFHYINEMLIPKEKLIFFTHPAPILLSAPLPFTPPHPLTVYRDMYVFHCKIKLFAYFESHFPSHLR